MLNASIYSLAMQLGEKLTAKKQTISCAESCTGGGVAFALTSVAGSSVWFKQSYVTYSNEAKHSLLGVSQDTLTTQGAVSQQTVEEMATGCAQKSAADFAIAISGIAGPGGGSDEKPVGLVWFGFFSAGKVCAQAKLFNGDREAVRMQAIEFALHRALVLMKPRH